MAVPQSDRSDESVEKVFGMIRKVHTKYPDLRVGQLLLNAVRSDLYNIENDSLVKALEMYLSRDTN